MVTAALVLAACSAAKAELPGATAPIPIATTIAPDVPDTLPSRTTLPADDTVPVNSPPTASTTVATTASTSGPPSSDTPLVATTLPPTLPTVPPTILATSGTELAPVFGQRFGYLAAAFNDLAAGNLAVSISVWRNHQQVYGQASGTTVGGAPVTPDTPLVLASVSKLITAITLARLAEQHRVDLDAPMPWDAIDITHDPAWNNVTPRELLAHTSGMPIARNAWLKLPGSCAIPLAEVMSKPPTAKRGTWVYSNGNYCALGLLIEHLTGTDRLVAAQHLVFDPIGVTGPHLTTAGLQRTDGPYGLDVRRLDRLGGAGTWMASTDDLDAILDAVTKADRTVLVTPGIITDQYGWGHTGTVDGAKACSWVMEDGRTIISAIVAGNKPAAGGDVCDEVVPALALDLGIYNGVPVRYPD